MKLDDEALAVLRDAIATVRPGSRMVPAATLRAATEALGSEVTVDLVATGSLGHPLVVLHPAAPREGADPCFATLSTREREVAALVAKGLRNKDIAQALFITVATVKDHVHRVLDKSGLDSRAAVAAAWSAHDVTSEAPRRADPPSR
ncbi:MAG: response regulator transcription factor [Myxococcales bacterium]|nr:response regulator transcription factor [Myxococcales bacterium]